MDKDTFFQKKHLLRIGRNYLNIDTPKIAGILNITPDSFYDGGRYLDKDAVMNQVGKMISEGAGIIDVGAASSRPGAEEIGGNEELERLARALGPIRETWPDVIISVDTTRADIARKVVEKFQVNIINDISGGTADPEMFDTLAEFQIPCIIMHMRGTPKTMQKNTDYSDLLKELLEYFNHQTETLKQKGIHDIIIDPGFGFSKTLEQNYQILYHLHVFSILSYPLMVGLSRKSMIYRKLNITPDKALNGTTALHMMALERGADIIRVHDVSEAKQTIELYINARSEGNKYTHQHSE